MVPRWMIAAWLALASSAVSAAESVELRTLLANEDFRRSWQRLMQAEERLPEWVINLDGQSFPVRALEADGKRYLFGKLCEPERCSGERLLVLVDWDKDRAHALYVRLPAALPSDRAPSGHATLRWLGEPDEQLQQLLQEQLALEPDWF